MLLQTYPSYSSVHLRYHLIPFHDFRIQRASLWCLTLVNYLCKCKRSRLSWIQAAIKTKVINWLTTFIKYHLSQHRNHWISHQFSKMKDYVTVQQRLGDAGHGPVRWDWLSVWRVRMLFRARLSTVVVPGRVLAACSMLSQSPYWPAAGSWWMHGYTLTCRHLKQPRDAVSCMLNTTFQDRITRTTPWATYL